MIFIYSTLGLYIFTITLILGMKIKDGIVTVTDIIKLFSLKKQL